MSAVQVVRRVDVKRTPRVIQVEGMFDMPPSKSSEHIRTHELPIDERQWQIGLIVGPSGSGKSSLLTELFGSPQEFEWPSDATILDAFPAGMGVRDVTGALSSVGLSSPPTWLRPYHVLSNGEQFRAHVARCLVSDDLAVLDEFTSVVDRTVAQVSSAAVAKYVRRAGKQLVAASCHYDIVEWLQPDWVYDCAAQRFTWECLQPRPRIDLRIFRSHRQAWDLFRHHHYLDTSLANSAQCYIATVNDRPAAFASTLPQPHRVQGLWREHRTVCLPDFQGVGIGNALSEFVGGVERARGHRYRSVTSHPAMIAHRARSPIWRLDRHGQVAAPGKSSRFSGSGKRPGGSKKWRPSIDRRTASFEYVGPAANPATLAAMGY